MSRRISLSSFVVIALLCGVNSFLYAKENVQLLAIQQANEHKINASIERDNIFSLLAYSVVLKNWQTDRKTGRGYNIGSVLVDENE